MQDDIGTGGDPFDANLASRRVEERDQFGSPVLGVFMGLFAGFSRLSANAAQDRGWSDKTHKIV